MARGKDPTEEVISFILDTAAAVGKSKYTAIQTGVEAKLRQAHPEVKEDEGNAPDVRTIKWILTKHFPSLPPEVVVAQFPASTWHLRDDYTQLKELAKDSTGRLNSHQEELHVLITEWKGQFKWPKRSDIPIGWGSTGRYRVEDYCWEVLEEIMFEGDEDLPNVNRTQIYCEVEDAPLFKFLKEHLKEEEVLALYEQFKRETGDYWFATNLTKDRQAEENLPNQPIDWPGGPYWAWSRSVEEIEASLTQIRRQIIGRLNHILSLDAIPGSCAECS